jgi:4-cresol dehydrogenase (hydroxylating)
MGYSHYENALIEWSMALGPENVITEPSSLLAAETGTFAGGHRIPAIIRPGTRQEVQECLRIANLHATPVYPISSGRNWGYGSRMPTADGCVLLDLGRMDRIVDFSEDLAYVTLEPGVTQAQLYASSSATPWNAASATPHTAIILHILAAWKWCYPTETWWRPDSPGSPPRKPPRCTGGASARPSMACFPNPTSASSPA